MDELLIRKMIKEEHEKLLKENSGVEQNPKITGYEFRVCIEDHSGGMTIDRFTRNEEEALFHKRYLEAQGKTAKIMVYSSVQEHSWEYDNFKKQWADLTKNR